MQETRGTPVCRMGYSTPVCRVGYTLQVPYVPCTVVLYSLPGTISRCTVIPLVTRRSMCTADVHAMYTPRVAHSALLRVFLQGIRSFFLDPGEEEQTRRRGLLGTPEGVLRPV